MKYFKKNDGSVWAFEVDGSQDELITAEFTVMTKEEIEHHLYPELFFSEEEKAARISATNLILGQTAYDVVSKEITALTQQIEDQDGDLESLVNQKLILTEYRKALRAFLKTDGAGELPKKE